MSTRIRVIMRVFTVIIKVTRKRVFCDIGVKMEYSQIFINRIRKLCKERGISVNKLATMSGVKQSTLDNIMRGLTKNPRVKTLNKVSIAFNMTLSEFLDFEELNNYSFEDEDDED